MSVGVVTGANGSATGSTDARLEAFWWETIRACPEVADLVQRRDASAPTSCRTGSAWRRARTGPSWAHEPVGDGMGGRRRRGDVRRPDPLFRRDAGPAERHRAAYTFNTPRRRPELVPGVALAGVRRLHARRSGARSCARPPLSTGTTAPPSPGGGKAQQLRQPQRGGLSSTIVRRSPWRRPASFPVPSRDRPGQPSC